MTLCIWRFPPAMYSGRPVTAGVQSPLEVVLDYRSKNSKYCEFVSDLVISSIVIWVIVQDRSTTMTKCPTGIPKALLSWEIKTSQGSGWQ